MTSILILNGPNLNLLGTRQPDVYGKTTLADIETMCRDKAKSLGFGIAFDQSNHEGALIDLIHAAKGEHAAIILNAGAYTHTSIAPVALGQICGFGATGYLMALDALRDHLKA